VHVAAVDRLGHCRSVQRFQPVAVTRHLHGGDQNPLHRHSVYQSLFPKCLKLPMQPVASNCPIVPGTDKTQYGARMSPQMASGVFAA
jgi:hypothetical protein